MESFRGPCTCMASRANSYMESEVYGDGVQRTCEYNRKALTSLLWNGLCSSLNRGKLAEKCTRMQIHMKAYSGCKSCAVCLRHICIQLAHARALTPHWRNTVEKSRRLWRSQQYQTLDDRLNVSHWFAPKSHGLEPVCCLMQ